MTFEPSEQPTALRKATELVSQIPSRNSKQRQAQAQKLLTAAVGFGVLCGLICAPIRSNRVQAERITGPVSHGDTPQPRADTAAFELITLK